MPIQGNSVLPLKMVSFRLIQYYLNKQAIQSLILCQVSTSLSFPSFPGWRPGSGRFRCPHDIGGNEGSTLGELSYPACLGTQTSDLTAEWVVTVVGI